MRSKSGSATYTTVYKLFSHSELLFLHVLRIIILAGGLMRIKMSKEKKKEKAVFFI